MSSGAPQPHQASTIDPATTHDSSKNTTSVVADPSATSDRSHGQCDGQHASSHPAGDAPTVAPTSGISPSHATLEEVCADVYGRVSRFLAAAPLTENIRRTQEQTRTSMLVIEEALKRYEFNTLSLSYNGGKDCLVLLILYLAVIHTHFHDLPTFPPLFIPPPSSPATISNSRPTPEYPPKSTSTQPPDPTANTISGDTKKNKFPKSIPSIYAKPPDPFPEVSSFVETSTKAYHLDLTHIETNPGAGSKPDTTAVSPSSTTKTNKTEKKITFRDAFALYLDKNPSITAIFVGTRRTDPHGAKLTNFDMTDGNWPRFMRIHPVIDWKLSEIWTFLKHPSLGGPAAAAAATTIPPSSSSTSSPSSSSPSAATQSDSNDGDNVNKIMEEYPLEYCAMYDLGYTSLGGVGDTLRNPRLKAVDEHGNVYYRPAYQMMEDEEERLGRE